MDTMWVPVLGEEGPRYRALADAIAAAIEEGELSPGARLPPVRELAWTLKVTPGTVARAYQLAVSRGLLDGQVGRGTYVRAAPVAGAVIGPAGPTTDLRALEMRLNFAVDIGQDVRITAAVERLIQKRGPLPLTDYHRFGEDLEERAAGVEWLQSGGVPAQVEDLVITSGAQHAMLTALAATAGGGDAIALTEPLIHPGLKDCARALGLRLEPVEMDADGLIPEAVDAAAARFRPGALVITLNHHNPTLATTPVARREAIAEIARRRRLQIIEDDVYGWLDHHRPPSFPSLVPDLTWYVTSFSKCVAAGLRAGFLLCPSGEGGRASRIIQGYTNHVSLLISGTAAELIRSGDVAEIIAEVRAETAARAEIAAAIFKSAPAKCETRPTAGKAWVTLPEPWRASEFVAAAAAEGVLISPAEDYAVGRAHAPHAVRLALCFLPREKMRVAAERVAALTRQEPAMVDRVA